MIIVLLGPSGTGKGTVVERLLEGDPRLALSTSWTTRPRREGEPSDAYVFVDRHEFEERVAAGGFLEHAEVFGGHLYGTPVPDPADDRDLLLEIDVQGARQVLQAAPDAVAILLVPPSREEQERRLRRRGDTHDQLAERLDKASAEEEAGRRLTSHVVVNDDLDSAVAAVAGIIETARADRRGAPRP